MFTGSGEYEKAGRPSQRLRHLKGRKSQPSPTLSQRLPETVADVLVLELTEVSASMCLRSELVAEKSQRALHSTFPASAIGQIGMGQV